MKNLDEIVALARQQLKLEALIADMEMALSDQKAMLRVLQEEDLPSAMKEAGLKTFTLDSGEIINIKPDFAVGIPSERREEAFDWLTAAGYGGIIKTEVTAAFGKGELEKAQKLWNELVKKKYNVGIGREVHWQTLKAFVVESIRETRKIPMDLFGVVPTNKAIIKMPK